MSAHNSRLRFHMGCGECLQSRRWIVNCAPGMQLREVAKSRAGKPGRHQRQRAEAKDET